MRIRRGCATVSGEPSDDLATAFRKEFGRREGIGGALSRKPGDLPDVLLEICSAPNRVVPSTRQPSIAGRLAALLVKGNINPGGAIRQGLLFQPPHYK